MNELTRVWFWIDEEELVPMREVLIMFWPLIRLLAVQMARDELATPDLKM